MSEAKYLGVIEQMLSWLILKQINQVIDDHSRLCVPSYITGPTHTHTHTYLIVRMCVYTHTYTYTHIHTLHTRTHTHYKHTVGAT